MKFFLILLIVLISCINCNTKKIYVDEKDYLTVQSFKIKDREFGDLIDKSIENYKKKYNESPKIILIELISNNENDDLIFYINNQLFLYGSQKDKLFINENFIAYGEIQKIPILIKNIGGEYKKFEKYFELGSKKKRYKFEYGNSINSCTQQFKVINGKISITNSYCAFDVYVR